MPRIARNVPDPVVGIECRWDSWRLCALRQLPTVHVSSRRDPPRTPIAVPHRTRSVQLRRVKITYVRDRTYNNAITLNPQNLTLAWVSSSNSLIYSPFQTSLRSSQSQLSLQLAQAPLSWTYHLRCHRHWW